MIELEEIHRSKHSATLENLLMLWAESMRGGDFEIGFPKESTCFLAAGKTHSEDWWDELDIHNASIMNTIINDLPEYQRMAINFEYLGNICIYKLTDFDYLDALHHAKIKIEEKAKIKGIW